jgi:hypothetical protein
MKLLVHLLTIGLLAIGACAQTAGTPVADQPAKEKAWDLSVSVSGYMIPDEPGYASPVFTADHKQLHLEGRYNYEAMRSGSTWIGYNFTFGDTAEFAFTPMLGAVFGDMTGVSPGYTASLDYKRLAFWTSGEFVFDTNHKAGNFFYNWSELSYHLKDWMRAGIAIQRTKAYRTKFDVQRGFLVGLKQKHANFTTYVFNAGWTRPTVVLTLGFEF